MKAKKKLAAKRASSQEHEELSGKDAFQHVEEHDGHNRTGG